MQHSGGTVPKSGAPVDATRDNASSFNGPERVSLALAAGAKPVVLRPAGRVAIRCVARPPAGGVA